MWTTCAAQGSPLNRQEIFSGLCHEPGRITFPDNASVLEDVETVGMRHSKRYVLLSEQHVCPSPKSFEGVRNLLDNNGASVGSSRISA
jgi:hypothetical protein